MRQVIVNNERYTAVNINTDILLSEESLALLYQNFHAARMNGTFDDGFTEYCKFCFATGAGLYLIEASKMNIDRNVNSVRVYKDSSVRNEREVLLYES